MPLLHRTIADHELVLGLPLLVTTKHTAWPAFTVTEDGSKLGVSSAWIWTSWAPDRSSSPRSRRCLS